MKFHYQAVMCVAAMVALAGCAATPRQHPAQVYREAGLERWADNHPEAANDLGSWVKNHPQAARMFFEWDGSHPERSRIFVTWAITHPGENIDVFVVEHPDWPDFNAIMERRRPAAQSFIHWCRRYPQAAETLMRHQGGLRWAGNHLYRAYWDMRNP